MWKGARGGVRVSEQQRLEEWEGDVQLVSETDEAVVRVGRGGVGRDALLVRAGVRVRVHRCQTGAAFHQALEVERDPVAGRADLYTGYFVVAERFVVV